MSDASSSDLHQQELPPEHETPKLSKFSRVRYPLDNVHSGAIPADDLFGRGQEQGDEGPETFYGKAELAPSHMAVGGSLIIELGQRKLGPALTQNHKDDVCPPVELASAPALVVER